MNTTTMLINVQCQAHFAQDIWKKYSWSFSQGHHVRLQHKQDETDRKQQSLVFSPKVNVQQILQPLYVKLALQHLSFSQLAVYKQHLLKESNANVTLLQAATHEIEHTNKTQNVARIQPSIDSASKITHGAETKISNSYATSITNEINAHSSWHHVQEVAQFFKQDRFLLSIMDKRKIVHNHLEHMKHLRHVMKSDRLLHAMLDEKINSAPRSQELEGNKNFSSSQLEWAQGKSSHSVPVSSSVSIVQPQVRMIWHERVAERQKIWNKQQEHLSLNNEQKRKENTHLAKGEMTEQVIIQRGQAHPLSNNQQNISTPTFSNQRLMHTEVLQYIASHHWKVDSKKIAQVKKFGIKDIATKTLKRIEQHFLSEQITFIYTNNPVKRKRGRPRKENSQLVQDKQAVSYRKASSRKSATVMKMIQQTTEVAVQPQQQLQEKQTKLSNSVLLEAATERLRFINKNWIEKVSRNDFGKTLTLIHFTKQAWKQATLATPDNSPSVHQTAMNEISERQQRIGTNIPSRQHVRKPMFTKVQHIELASLIHMQNRQVTEQFITAKWQHKHVKQVMEEIVEHSNQSVNVGQKSDMMLQQESSKSHPATIIHKQQPKHKDVLTENRLVPSPSEQNTVPVKSLLSSFNKARLVPLLNSLKQSGLQLDYVNKSEAQLGLPSYMHNRQVKIHFLTTKLSQKHTKLIGNIIDEKSTHSTTEKQKTSAIGQKERNNLLRASMIYRKQNERQIRTQIEPHHELGQADEILIKQSMSSPQQASSIDSNSSILVNASKLDYKLLVGNHSQTMHHMRKIQLRQQMKTISQRQFVTLDVKQEMNRMRMGKGKIQLLTSIQDALYGQGQDTQSSKLLSQEITVPLNKTLLHGMMRSVDNSLTHSMRSLADKSMSHAVTTSVDHTVATVSQPLALKRVEPQAIRKQVALLVKEEKEQRPKGTEQLSSMQTQIKKLEEQIKEQQLQFQDARNPLVMKQLMNQIYEEISRKIKFENQRLGR